MSALSSIVLPHVWQVITTNGKIGGVIMCGNVWSTFNCARFSSTLHVKLPQTAHGLGMRDQKRLMRSRISGVMDAEVIRSGMTRIIAQRNAKLLLMRVVDDDTVLRSVKLTSCPAKRLI